MFYTNNDFCNSNSSVTAFFFYKKAILCSTQVSLCKVLLSLFNPVKKIQATPSQLKSS